MNIDSFLRVGVAAALVSACSAGTPAADGGGAGSGGAGGPPALVAECQGLANNFANFCMNDTQRPCMWNAYAKLCMTGQTQLLIDSMKCLDQTTCRTFSDPNQGQACLTTLHASSGSTAANMLIQSTCAACGGTNCAEQQAIDEVLPYLSNADVAALNSCRGSACDLTTIVKTCATVAGLGLFAGCVH